MAGMRIVLGKRELVFETWPEERGKTRYILLRWFRYGLTFNYRYRKNHPSPKAECLILLMFLYKLLGSPIKFVFLPLRVIWDKRPLVRIAAMSVVDVALAMGLIAPFFGIKLNRYY